MPGLERALADEFWISLDIHTHLKAHDELDADGIARFVVESAAAHFAGKQAQIGGEMMRNLEKHVMLTVIDKVWKEHLSSMDYLLQGRHLRGYATKQKCGSETCRARE